MSICDFTKNMLTVFLFLSLIGCEKEDKIPDPVVIVDGADYYVATNGNDRNPGTIDLPWKTWGKAFSIARAGDTVYIRGGTYVNTLDINEYSFNSGSNGNPICFFNYPGEVPVLDCSNNVEEGYYKGIRIWHADNIHIKGLQVKNLYQKLNSNVVGVDLWDVGNITLENMVVHDVAGEAYVVYDFHNTIKYINCDAYNMCDALRTAVYPTPGSPGQNGAGFHFGNYNEFSGSRESKLFYKGCRAWNFSDNGFAGTSVGYVEWDSCWAFNGGQLSGEGCGFKYASTYRDDNTLPLARMMKNCISAVNGAYGFSPNNSGDNPLVGHYYSNSAYHNGYKENIGHGLAYGWIIMDTDTYTPTEGEMYSNNLSYKNEKADAMAVHNQPYNHRYNSWDQQVTITDEDFVSLDWTEMLRSRKPDGSLPDINFLKLKKGSDLIDAGVNVDLPFLGTAPDLGAFEAE